MIERVTNSALLFFFKASKNHEHNSTGSLTSGVSFWAGMLFPKSIAAFVGIQPITALGISEIRATLGSFFLVLGATCLWLQSADAFTVVGTASIAAATVRLLSGFIDKSTSVKNIGGVISEALLGALFLLSWGLT